MSCAQLLLSVMATSMHDRGSTLSPQSGPPNIELDEPALKYGERSKERSKKASSPRADTLRAKICC